MILFILDKINIAIKTPAALLQIYYCCKITRYHNIISSALQNTNLSVKPFILIFLTMYAVQVFDVGFRPSYFILHIISL